VNIRELIPPAPYGNPKQVEDVLVKLADARLITTSEDTVEVAHEALIREWPTLREWLSQDREGLRVHRHLTEATQEWELMKRDPSSLYRGARLAQALEWAETNPQQINSQELAFLEASREASERDIREREAQRLRELEASKKLAETQTNAAQRLRRRAWLLAGVTVLALLLATAALFLGNQAAQRANLATSRELANAATNNLGIEPERSVLLALEALKKADTLAARNALHQALPELHILRSFLAHDSAVTSVIHSPDGKLLASTSADRTVKIWDAQTGELLRTIGFEKDTWDVAFSPDGTVLATASYTQVVGLDPQTGQQLFALNGKEVGWEVGYNLGTGQVDYSPDGKFLVVANMDGHPVVWDLATQKIILTLDGHKDIVYGIDLSPDGKLIATASRDGTVRIWDAMTAQPLITLAQATSAWFDAQFSPDGSRLAAVNEGADVKIWAVDGWTELMSLANPETGGYQGLGWSSDGASLATASYDGVTRILDAYNGQLLINLPGHVSTVLDVNFSPDGKRLVSSGADRMIKIWDTGSGRELLTIKADSDNVRVAYSPNGLQFASVGVSGTPKIWDADSGQLLRTLPATNPPHVLMSVAFNPNGKRLAAGSVDGIVTVWDLEKDQIALSWQAHLNSIAGINFSPDGKRLVTCAHDGLAIIWDVESGQALVTFDGHARNAPTLQLKMMFSVAFSPDGQRVASGGFDGTARVWDSMTGKEIFNVTDNKALGFSAVAFSPDGKLLAAGEFDSPLLIVDAATGIILHRSTGHSAAILDARFSADGKYIATASFDRLGKLWDATSGQELASFYGNAKNAWSVSINSDGKHLAVGGWDGTARIYIIPLDELVNLAQTRLTRQLTTEECQKYLHVEQCPANDN
jgi:WD40 repeat protein